MNSEIDKKLEDMLVIPFMVILYSCILIPLFTLSYQCFQWLRTDSWTELSLLNLLELFHIEVSFLNEPGWTGVKNIISAFLDWPLAIGSAVLIFFTGWILIIIFCVAFELLFNNSKKNLIE